jgi:2-polyprenyl-6-hydroxyphenyl methylase/3-demethylubiquinone-9 3-methyltransferase
MENSDITFSFGKNWQNLLKVIDEDSFLRSRKDLERWFSGRIDLNGKDIIDIGSGSGIHSFVLYSMNPAKLFSFDYDPNSVAATKSLWEKAGSPEKWKVEHGSILDKKYLAGLGNYDLVYSWGVLHHTGSMWEAIKNASDMVKPGGYFLISIYQGVKTYEYDLALKKKYNAAGAFGKKKLEWQKYIWPLMKQRMKQRKNPFGWNEKRIRGMDTYHDIVDWLGGLPYEVASDTQMIDFFTPLGFTLIEKDMSEACGTYLMHKK